MRLLHKITLFAVLLTLTVSARTAYAQGGETAHFEYLTVEDGLSNSAVMFILRDSDGFMWFGTKDGLNRYDGYEVTVFRHSDDDPHSLSNNVVMSGYAVSNGALWFGTDLGGLNKYDKNTGQFTAYTHDSDNPDSISNNSVWAISEDHSGALWRRGVSEWKRRYYRIVRL